MPDLRVGATGINKVYLGSTALSRVYLGADLIWLARTSSDFDLAAANGNVTGITWDGLHFRVVDASEDKVFAYDAAGVYQSALDFNLTTANGSPEASRGTGCISGWSTRSPTRCTPTTPEACTRRQRTST